MLLGTYTYKLFRVQFMEDTYTRCVVRYWTGLGDLIVMLLRETDTAQSFITLHITTREDAIRREDGCRLLFLCAW